MRTLAKVARDIYPHDHLADRYYIAAVAPWDAKAASDPKVKAMLEEGVGGCIDRKYARYHEITGNNAG